MHVNSFAVRIIPNIPTSNVVLRWSQEEIERLQAELKGCAALERIYKTTIEEKDAEVKAKTRRVEMLEAENLALKEKLVRAGGEP